jgi:type III secretory pathway component EscS
MWRQLLASTDQTGRTYVTVAVILFAAAVASFLIGVVQALTGHAAGTLPFWIGTMICAACAGGLIYAASRRGDTFGR